MPATASLCPRCHSVQVERHCDQAEYPGADCNLIRCKGCGGFGKPDGSRWARSS